MTSKELVAKAVNILREDLGLYEIAIVEFTVRDLFFLICARFDVILSNEEISEELMKNDSVETYGTNFRLKWEPSA